MKRYFQLLNQRAVSKYYPMCLNCLHWEYLWHLRATIEFLPPTISPKLCSERGRRTCANTYLGGLILNAHTAFEKPGALFDRKISVLGTILPKFRGHIFTKIESDCFPRNSCDQCVISAWGGAAMLPDVCFYWKHENSNSGPGHLFAITWLYS